MPEVPKLPPIANEPLTLVLLAWNEESHLESTLQNWLKFAQKREGETSILLLDDGSTDRTSEIADSESRVTVHRHETHRGLGACLQSGFAKTSTPLIAVSLCDPVYKPENLETFLREVDHVHMVTGYRAGRSMPVVLRGLGVMKRGLSKLMLSLDQRPLPGFLGRRGHCAGWLARLIFGLRLQDVACPFFVVRKEILKHAPIQSEGAFGLIELLAKVNYLKALFAEQQIPIDVQPTLGKWRDASLRSTIAEAKKVFSHPDFRARTEPGTPSFEEYPSMIHVIATVELNEGKREEFLNEFRQLVPKVNAEEGCLEYGPTGDATTEIPAQIPMRDNVVTVVEKWASLEALEAHLAAPHMMEYRGKVKDFVKSVSLQILEPL